MSPPDGRRAFTILFREFFAQFFTSETVASEIQLRTVMTGVIAFLLVPGILLVVELFFDYQGIVLRAIRHRQFELLTDTLEWIEFLFVTYSMVTIGFVAVFEWDALGFDRRDAMVLGPLPVRGPAIVAAKLAALAALLLAVSLAVNVPGAFVFAFATADRLGASALIRHFAGHLTATVAAAAFVFAGLVALRAAAGLAAGPRLAAMIGTALQFLFVVALLVLVILCPYVLRVPHRALVNPTVTGWLPSTWFMALFERIRESPRHWMLVLSTRAALGLPATLVAATMLSIAGYRRETRRALAPAATPGAIADARSVRYVARLLAGRSPRARAVADFVLLTIARNRPQQAVIAVNVAAGVGLAIAGIATRPGGVDALAVPRVAVLWVPLVVTYAVAVGFRAACFVPGDLPAAWTFQVDASAHDRAALSGVRAAATAVLVPASAIGSSLLVPLAGWHVASWAGIVAMTAALAVAESLAATVGFVPFTRPYEPGHAKLRTRWPLYAVGLVACAYLPAKIEARRVGDAVALASLAAGLLCAAAAAHVVGRRSGNRWPARASDPDEFYRVTVLDIGALTQDARVR